MNKDIDLTKFQQKCGGGRCPKILINDNGDALVQGVAVDCKILKGLDVPGEENVVFLPREVVDEFVRNYSL